MGVKDDNKITKEDLHDVDFVDAEELRADGYTVFRTVALSHTESNNSTVIIDPADFLDLLNSSLDNPPQIGDFVYIYQSTEADGYYIITDIIDSITFSVDGYIFDSTGGFADFIHPSGASNVGFDATGLTTISADNVQEALEQVDVAINKHETLDTLTHNLVEDGYDVITRDSSNRVINVTIWTDDTLTKKIREDQVTRLSSGLVQEVVEIQYDENGIELYRVTETIVRDSNSRVVNIIRNRS